jgi:hypothetical protein
MPKRKERLVKYISVSDAAPKAIRTPDGTENLTRTSVNQDALADKVIGKSGIAAAIAETLTVFSLMLQEQDYKHD